MANMVRKTYEKLKAVPGGRLLFSKFVGYAAPYSGTICPSVEELKDGYARVSMSDRRFLRNHLKSVHAIAMMNLAELTTGLALTYGLPDDARGILTKLEIEYKKKGRGKLTAECTCTVPKHNKRAEYDITAEIRDTSNDVVAKASARWLVGPGKI
jgi:acyl-coenzyme A thioesterase PaaI-like protein